MLPGAGVIADQVARVEQQIVERELAGAAAAVGVPADEVVERAEQAVERVAADGVGELVARFGCGVPAFARLGVALVLAGRFDRGIGGELSHTERERIVVGVAVVAVAERQEAADEVVDSGVGFGAVLDQRVVVGDALGFGDPPVQCFDGVGKFRCVGGRTEVAVTADLVGGGANVGDIESVAEHFFERGGVGGVALGPEPVAPGVFEVEGLRELVEHPEVGIEAGLEGALVQEAGGESVDGLDVGDVDLFLRVGQPFALVCGRTGGKSFGEALADAGAEFASCLFGEGDSDDFAQFGGALSDGLDDALDHHAGFACACAGLEEEGGIEFVDDAIADGLVGGGTERVGRLAHRLAHRLSDRLADRLAHQMLRWATSVSKSAVRAGWRTCLWR